jgi:SPP1 family predicted phage head-tail adaptor
VRCCDITSGKLSSKIVIERNTPTSDGEGGLVDAWAADPAGGVWAMVVPLGGAERFFAERVTPGNALRCVIRFRGGGNGAPYYSARDRISYKGRTYGIESVVDIDDEERFLEILASENKAS